MLRFVDMGLKPPTVHWKVCFPVTMGKVELGDGNRLSIVMNMLLALPGLKRNRRQGGQSFPLVDLHLDRGVASKQRHDNKEGKGKRNHSKQRHDNKGQEGKGKRNHSKQSACLWSS